MKLPIRSAGQSVRDSAITPLALDLSDEAVTLYARTADQGWVAVASVPTDADDFLSGIADLRTEARIRDECDGPVTLWLPSEQVLVRSYHLDGSGADARLDACNQLAAETPYARSELMYAFSPYRSGSPTTVLAALTQTVLEARGYATKWGFTPGPVSTRVAEGDFGASPPVFRAPEPTPVRVARRASVFGMAACVIGAALMGIYSLSQMPDPLVVPKVEKPKAELVFAMVQLHDSEPPVTAVPLRPVGKGGAQSLAIQRALALSAPLDANLSAPFSAPVHMAGAPPLRTPRMRQRLQIGSASGLPARRRPGKLDDVIVLPPRKPVALARAHIEAVRKDAREESELADSIARPSRSLDTAADAGSLVAAVLPSSALPVPEPIPSPRTPPESGTEPDNALATEQDLEPTALAPLSTDIKPKRRPQQAPQELPELAAVEQEEDLPELAATASLVAPPAKPEAIQPAAPDEPEVDVAEEDDAPTKLAVLVAPTPLTRPKSIEAKPVLRQQSRTTARDNAPKSVRHAASQVGLAMGETNLIGVLQGSNGRQALVRLRDGGYLKVSRGDDVDGWRVRSIGRETLRLSRRGQNRTLMLVSR